MYNWEKHRYEKDLYEELEDAIYAGELTEGEANLIFIERMLEWEAGYGDYLYDIRGDR